MLHPETLGAVYLTIFRVSIVVAGIISIVCGYRLFLAGVFRLPSGASPTEIAGRFGGVELTLKSSAPGTCFALFGVIVIGIMIVSAPPEFGRSRSASVSPSGELKVTEELKMRGEAIGIGELVDQAKQEEKQGNKKKAMEVYEKALRVIAEPLNNLAWLYHEAARDKEAVLLAQLATQFAPAEAEFADTLNRIRARDRKGPGEGR